METTNYRYEDCNYSAERERFYFEQTHIDKMWRRCRELGLTPGHIPRPKRISGGMLSALQAEYSYFIDIIKSYTKKIELIISTDIAVIDIYTKDSIIIDRMGNVPELDSISYSLGCVITEEEFGNFAINRCIKEDSPTVVFGDEHFLDVFKSWACFCVPIHDASENIIVALAIVLPEKYAKRNMLGLIMVAVRGIENEIMLLDEKIDLTTTNEILTEFNAGVIKTASMLSHEIRNSLSTISAYIQLLQLQDSLTRGEGDKILTEIGRANKLLNKFSTLSEPAKLQLYKHSLADILKSVVSSLSPRARISNIDMELELEKDQIFVMVNLEYMERVFINIVVNAIQAMEDDGGKLKIICTMESEKKQVRIVFQDTGPGIDEEELDDIFRPFYTTKLEGTGLGLAMSRHIVKSHGGKILVESAKGIGTKFIIILPCIKAETTE